MGVFRVGPEKSCGAVLYRCREGKPEYLIIETRGGHVSFPKGHVEGQETEFETALREIREETGITKVQFHDRFREVFTYYTKTGNVKDVIYFLASFAADQVALQQEELKNWWIVPFERAVQLVNTETEREILTRANEMLEAEA